MPRKYYVVWNGLSPGVYDNWVDCKLQIHGVENAKYKSFPTKEAAEKALEEGFEKYFRKKNDIQASLLNFPVLSTPLPQPNWDSWSVDAACNMVTRVMEYRCVKTRTKEVIFHKGPFQGGTNNIGEFLALVHALALQKKLGLNLPIYSDSITAIAWVRKKKHKSIIAPTIENAILFDLLNRAEIWLNNNTFTNPIIKWNTPAWGEIPADFGRK